MTNSKARVLVVVCVAFMFSATAWASDPVGVYGIIEKVVFEPDATAPQRVQVWGAFALSDGKPGDTYLPPQRGYLYYTLAPGKEEICRKEWADLASIAGSGQAVGFGFRYDGKTRLRQPTDKVEAPDTFPIAMGMTRIGSARQPALIARIKETLQSQ